jgi:hypothetical protein
VAKVQALADEWATGGIPCVCGHTLDTHNGLGCYERVSYEPLVKCDCELTDDRHDGQLAAAILRTLAPDTATPGEADPDRHAGLYGKYRVERISDPTGKHADCRCFVLDPQHDPIAREALAHYSHLANARGFIPLSNDLDAWLRSVAASPVDDKAGEGK